MICVCQYSLFYRRKKPVKENLTRGYYTPGKRIGQPFSLFSYKLFHSSEYFFIGASLAEPKIQVNFPFLEFYNASGSLFEAAAEG